MDFLTDYYSWLKALHLIAVISWMAGLLYLPRLFVYHAMEEKGSQASEKLEIMEHKLLRLIMNPAMIVTWVLGLAMFFGNLEYFKTAGWMHGKFLLVIVLSGFHMACAKWRREFAHGQNKHSHKFYRYANEVPTVLMIIIVILAIIKPF